MDIALFSGAGVEHLFRWGHMVFGVAWIGLLYYFNFVQTEYFKEAEDAHRELAQVHAQRRVGGGGVRAACGAGSVAMRQRTGHARHWSRHVPS